MKTKQSYITLLKKLLLSILNSLKEKELNEEKLLLDFKMKLLHSNKSLEQHNLPKPVNSVLQKNRDSLSTLKLLYLIQYKDKIDQQQTKRSIINNINVWNSTSLSTERYVNNSTLENVAYKNTYHINSVYQLYKFNHYLNEDKII